jgi:hypothetical protein
VQRAELLIHVQEALNSMDPIDREVLALRHFEMLSNAESAVVLGISKKPRQQNSWVNSGSGNFPRLWYKAVSIPS